MNNDPVFESVQQLLSQGDTGQALELLIQHLEKEGSQPEIVRSLRVVEANYQSVRQQEIKGLVDFSELRRAKAQANDAILSLLDDLKSGRKPLVGQSGTGDGRVFPWPWIIVGAILLIAGIWMIRSNQKKEGPLTASNSEIQCPSFQSPGSKVIILPFLNLGESKRRPELSIQSRIRELTKNNNLATSVEILTDPKLGSDAPDDQTATQLGKHCQADMIIWGQYEPLEKDSISVDIHYAFVNADWPPGAAIQTFKNVTEIKTAKELNLANLDDAIFRICTALALHNNNLPLAEKWLNKIKKPNQREEAWKKILKQ